MPVWCKNFLLFAYCTRLSLALLTAQNAHFESLTIEHGLSQGMVFDILQTRDGFLWIATKNGLNRYDGYNFKVYSHDPFDPNAIADDNVALLFEDSRGWLWAGTVNKRLDVFDAQTGRFHHLPLHFDISPKASPQPICNMAEAPDGSVWVLYPGGDLFRISIPAALQHGLPKDTELAQQLTVTKIQIETLNQNEEEMESCWFAADGSLVLFSSTKQYRVEKGAIMAKPVENPRLPAMIFAVSRGANEMQNELWVLGDQNQLFCFTDNELSQQSIPEAWESDRVKFKTDAQGKCWMIHGPNIWQLSAHKRIDFLRPDWTLDRDVTQIGTDRNENMWIGTFGYGLRRINAQKRSFQTAVAGSSIWRLWRSPTGQYYCRKGLNRIYHFDAKTGLADPQLAFPELGEKGRKDILFEPSGHFWLLVTPRGVITTEGFLRYYDTHEKCLKEYPFAYLGYDYARLFADRDGYLWITGAQCQLIRFDPRSGQFEYFDYSAVFGEKAQTVQAIAITQDGNGRLWIGTQLGLVKTEIKADKLDFQLLRTDGNNPKGLNNNAIACLLPDPQHPDKILWIGTKGGGINCLDLQNGQIGHLTMADGLPDKVIYGILPGNEKPSSGTYSLWCSTNRGLLKLSVQATKDNTRAVTPKSKLDKVGIKTFTAAKGLQDNEFNTQSFFKADNGEMLFGGVNGLNHFFPEQVRSDTMPPPVFIVGIEINHKSVSFGQADSPLSAPIEYIKELYLDYDQNNISFEFSALDFSAPAQNRYRYQLTGLDADWVETGSIRFAHFTHLAPGDYEFRVQGNNGEGDWQEVATSIKIIISPPWYRTNAAWLMYVLLLAGAAWQIYRFQIQRVKEREQLAFEQRETERVKAMEQVKVNFFSNVTHELRTPLSMIIEPLRQYLKAPNDPTGLEKIRLAERNSHKLLGLVNQLLDLAKIESGSMGLDLRQNDLLQLIRGTYQSFLPLAEKHQLRLSLSLPKEFAPFSFDAEKVELILNNLISNALKFTPEGGQIKIHLENSEGNFALLNISDTGIGIPPDALDKIFDRFYQVDHHHETGTVGTGIGLALSRELAELMGGTLTVESEWEKGSVFTLSIPLTPPNTVGQRSQVLAQMQEQTAPFAPETTHIPSKWANPEKPIALIVEDNAELRYFIKNSIGVDWDVIEASNGEEGLKKSVDMLPDLIVSDVMMPDKDGYTLCDELKKNELTAHIPIILLTAKSTLDAKLKGLRTGADDYLTKPFHTDELLARMENLVENRRRLRAHFAQQPGTEPTNAATESETAFLGAADREFLRKFTLIVEKNLALESLSVEDLAQKMMLSRVQLYRKIKAITDQNVTDFVRDYRLERAMTMLKNREGMVYEIAYKVGFGSEKYFSRAFKEKYGLPPGQFM